MQITSRAFENNQKIPAEFTCEGNDINPPLTIHDVPEETQSLALIMDDPDTPTGTWDHWIVYNIEPTVTEIAPNSIPAQGTQIINSFRKLDYGGPCPPPGPQHRYFFKVYALDTMLDSSLINDKPSLLSAMQGHILTSAELIGLYSRS